MSHIIDKALRSSLLRGVKRGAKWLILADAHNLPSLPSLDANIIPQLIADPGSLGIYPRALYLSQSQQAFNVVSSCNPRQEILHLAEGGRRAASDFLTCAALRGYLPKQRACVHDPNAYGLGHGLYFMHLEPRPFRIRPGRPPDLDALYALELQCWSGGLAMSRETLALRLQRYAAGQFVLEDDTGIQGVLYTQLIHDIQEIHLVQAQSADSLHDPLGRITMLLALNINPDLMSRGYGGKLLEFGLQKAGLLEGSEYACGVTRCVDYPGSSVVRMNDYLRRKPLDPILRMHKRHGAELRCPMPDYRPKDERNEGYGVLVVYDLATRDLELHEER